MQEELVGHLVQVCRTRRLDGVVLRPVVPSPLRSCWNVASSRLERIDAEPETTSDWLFQLPLLSTFHTMYWSALPFFQTTW